jgi:thiol oxidase
MQQLPKLWPADAAKDPWGEGSEGKAPTDVCTVGGKAVPAVHASAQYVACKGSKPDSRGFTCGLWLLFHTTAAR